MMTKVIPALLQLIGNIYNNNMVRIGYLAPMGLLAALIADYFVTPALISYTKPFGKEKIKDKK